MITKAELAGLLKSAETYRVERTISLTDKDKFGEAICAFANDMPDTGKPGYLLIGVHDDGTLNGLKATDELLKKFADIRSNGTILPIPVMSVDAFHFDNGDVIAVEVLPSAIPPVRYRGRTWIRIGPRRDIATLDEERILSERRARQFASFDVTPCYAATMENIDVVAFERDYLPRAIAADLLTNDDRPIERKMESLRLYNTVIGHPTNAAVILFGKNPRQFIPGAFVQYVLFSGQDRNAAAIENEQSFYECLFKSLPKLETFIETAIARRRPVQVSAMREETEIEYPNWAIRELIMNAVMHRDYQGNAPVRFFQFSDRLEIQNHGGLFGRARPENFPNVNDYRNPVIAEAMKVLGYVNTYNLGIAEAQRQLAANGNPAAVFDVSLQTAFKVTIFTSKTPRTVSLNDKKCPIDDENALLASGESPIEKLIAKIGYSRPRAEKIRLIHAKFANGDTFGRADISAIIVGDYRNIGRILESLERNQAIVPVSGEGKGRYRFTAAYLN